jgi:hypothetical protein
MTMLNWLITSSADPRKTSLAVKGAIVLGGSQLIRLLDIVCSFGLACLGVDATIINQAAEGVEALVYGVLVLWGIVWVLWGMGRKIYLARWSAVE